MVLTLRPIRLTDWPRIHEWASRPEASRFQPWGPNTAEETKAFAAGAVQAWEATPLLRRTYVAEARTDGVVGLGELTVRSDRWQRAEISYAVHTAYWGQGLAGRLAERLCAIAFGELDMHRVEATCDPRNTASARVLLRLGMMREGTLRHMMKLTDGWRDSDIYSLLRPDWESRRADN